MEYPKFRVKIETNDETMSYSPQVKLKRFRRWTNIIESKSKYHTSSESAEYYRSLEEAQNVIVLYQNQLRKDFIKSHKKDIIYIYF